MPFYEVVYEDGSHSVGAYDSDEEATTAVEAHHQRAVNGEKSLSSDPSSPPAVRVKHVFVYDEHPNEYNPDQNVASDEALTFVKDFLKDRAGVVNVQELAAGLRDMSNPMVESGPHESNYKMQEGKELEGAWQ